MPYIGYYCPDGKTIKIDECLTKCRLDQRCLSKPTLKKISEQREWTGIPSTTQLLNGTRYTMLIITKKYYIKPQSMAYALLGTKFHQSLENHENFPCMEQGFIAGNMTGKLDYYELEDKTLIDYKTWGSYKVKKALGLVSKKIIDPSGARYKRSGKGYKAGDKKKITIWEKDETQIDCWEAEYQLNRYRIWLENENNEVEKMFVEVTVRDGGIQAAVNNGITEKMYLIPIKRIDNEYILNYFNNKIKALRNALATGKAPRCSDKECWNGIRCSEEYCPVIRFCEVMG